jgi:hypothetical protein
MSVCGEGYTTMSVCGEGYTTMSVCGEGYTTMSVSGKAVTMMMGCYGIGVTRVVAAAIEQNYDERGIIALEYLSPNWKICPTSIPRLITNLPLPSGEASPATALRKSAASNLKSTTTNPLALKT